MKTRVGRFALVAHLIKFHRTTGQELAATSKKPQPQPSQTTSANTENNMEIVDKDEFKTVVEYDFTFTSGMRLPIMVDLNAGDRVIEDDKCYTLDLVAKPSISEEEMLQPEVATIYKANLAALILRPRKLRIASVEEKVQFKKLLEGYKTKGTVQ